MPINLRLQPSRWMLVYLLLINAVALFAVTLLPLDLSVFIVGSSLALGHALYSLYRFSGWAAKRRVVGLCYRDHCWTLSVVDECGGVRDHLVQLRSATVWSWLQVLNFSPLEGGPSRCVVILPDSVDADGRRHLRVALRHLPVWGRSG